MKTELKHLKYIIVLIFMKKNFNQESNLEPLAFYPSMQIITNHYKI